MKMNRAIGVVVTFAVFAGLASAQASPPMETSATIGGKKIAIRYSAPSVKGRKIFGGADTLQPNNTVWRAGANNATALHTDGDITIGTLNVPAGDYTLYVFLDPKGWQLVVSRQTGQWGINRDGSTTLDASKAVGRTPMTMKHAPMVETYRMILSPIHGDDKKCTLTLEWENISASVDISAK